MHIAIKHLFTFLNINYLKKLILNIYFYIFFNRNLIIRKIPFRNLTSSLDIITN